MPSNGEFEPSAFPSLPSFARLSAGLMFSDAAGLAKDTMAFGGRQRGCDDDGEVTAMEDGRWKMEDGRWKMEGHRGQ